MGTSLFDFSDNAPTTWTWQVMYPSQNSNAMTMGGPSYQTIKYVHRYMESCNWVSSEPPRYEREPKPPVMPERLM
jgi:hypothetical protein